MASRKLRNSGTSALRIYGQAVSFSSSVDENVLAALSNILIKGYVCEKTYPLKIIIIHDLTTDS